MLNSYEEYSNSSEETIPVIVNDDDTPIMMPVNLLSLAIEKEWLKGREDE